MRVAGVQLLLVSVVFSILGLTLGHAFLEDWGWLVGPAAWLGCAGLTARVVGLAYPGVLVGAVASGLASAIGVLIGVHSVGIVVAIGLFALWSGRLDRPAPAPA